MATPTDILPGNGYFIAEENTTTGISPNSGTNIGTVVAGTPEGDVGVGQQVIFSDNNVVRFRQGANSFAVVPVGNILLTYTGAPS